MSPMRNSQNSYESMDITKLYKCENTCKENDTKGKNEVLISQLMEKVVNNVSMMFVR